MRFFGAKHRKKDGQPQAPRLASVRETAETRTDVAVKKDGAATDPGKRELYHGNGVVTQQQQQPQQQQQLGTPKRRVVTSKSPTARPSSRSRGGERETPTSSGGGGIRSPGPSPRQLKGANDSDHSRQSAASRHRSSPKQPKQQTSFGSGASKSTAKTTNNTPKAKSPPSILHKNTHFGSPTNAAKHVSLPPPPPSDISPLPMYSMTHNPRVRFMSSEQSVASTEASNVHLMAGAAGSVASSSAMSSSADRENVFDRVLHMVMAEEHERLNAMGMSRSPSDSKSQAAAMAKKASQKKAAKEKFAKADAKAKAVVAAVVGDSHSGSDDDLGLLPPNRMDLAPIDIDTGLEIGGSYDAPIDMDTGLEVHHKSPIDMDTGLEVEYHDMNDEEVDEERWRRLNSNEKALLTSGMEGLSMNKDQRSRSYENGRSSSSQQSPKGKHHNRGASSGSDPVIYQRTNSGSAEAGGGWAPSPSSMGGWGKKSPGRKSAGGIKKTKKFWDKSKDLQTDEWVAFDKQGPNNNTGDNRSNTKGAATSAGRVSDLVTF